MLPHHRTRTALRLLLLTLLCGVFAIQGAVSAHEEEAEARKAVIQQIYDEVFNAGDLDTVDALYAPDYVAHGFGDDLTLDGFKAYVSAMRAALPDFAAEVEVLIADHEWAASRVIFSGTFMRAWVMPDQTIPPTEGSVEWSLNLLHRFDEDDLLAEDFAAFDSLSLLLKLGAAPVPRFIAAALTSTERAPAVMGDPVSGGTQEDHIAAFTHVIEDAINQGELTAIDDSMAADYLTHEPFGEFTREQFKGVITGFRATVPDLAVTIDAVVAEGDWLAARLTYVGTFSNPISNGFITIEPTNAPIKFIINVLVRYNEDGIGIEDFKEYNRLGWLRQVNLLPAAS